MNVVYKITFFCGLTPLVLAIIILTGWFLTNNELFLIAGLFNILGGIALFLVCMCCLILYEYLYRKEHQATAFRKLVLPLGIMLLNFPAAGAAVYSVIFMRSVSHIQVINNSQEFISEIDLHFEYSESRKIKNIMPNDKKTKYMRFKTSGSVDYSLEFNGQTKVDNFIGYTSRERGNNVVMTISSTGDVFIEQSRNKRF